METAQIESWDNRAFKALDTEAKGYLTRDEILDLLVNQGVYNHHSLAELIRNLEAKDPKDQILFEEFKKLVHGLFFLKRVLEWDLTIPHFDKFRSNL